MFQSLPHTYNSNTTPRLHTHNSLTTTLLLLYTPITALPLQQGGQESEKSFSWHQHMYPKKKTRRKMIQLTSLCQIHPYQTQLARSASVMETKMRLVTALQKSDTQKLPFIS